MLLSMLSSSARVHFGVLATALISGCVGEIQSVTSPPIAADSGAVVPVVFDAGATAPDDAGRLPENDAGVQTPFDGGMPAVPDAGPAEVLTLGIWNVLADVGEPAFRPLPPTLNLVELPPQLTLQVEASAAVKSVRFQLDNGAEQLDKNPPFRLSENANGNAVPWSVTPGMHRVQVTGYSTADGTGAPLGSREASFELSALGLQPNFKPLSAADNAKWLNDKLEQSMVASELKDGAKSLRYRLFVPPGYSDKVKYPLVIYLHGRGERGTDNRYAIVQYSKLFTGPRSLVAPNGQYSFPAIVLVPQCSDEMEQPPAEQEWAHWVGNLGSDGNYTQAAEPSPSASRVLKAIDALKAKYSIDSARIYLTGISMGGFGSWEFTTRWPDRWAAAIPMAGFSDRSKVSKITKIPYWVFHHQRDEYNPVAGSQKMTQALKNAGGIVKYTEYDYVGNPNGNGCFYHCGSFDKAYSDEADLLPWLFSQRKR